MNYKKFLIVGLMLILTGSYVIYYFNTNNVVTHYNFFQGESDHWLVEYEVSGKERFKQIGNKVEYTN